MNIQNNNHLILIIMKVKNIIQRNLDLSKEYFFVSSKYISLIDGNGCTCDNCNKLISNIVTIKDNEGKFYNVGSDCADTLQSLQNDYNYFLNKDNFNEGKQLRAKFLKAIKNNLIKSLKINEDYLLFERLDGSQGWQKMYSPEITISYVKDLLTE